MDRAGAPRALRDYAHIEDLHIHETVINKNEGKTAGKDSDTYKRRQPSSNSSTYKRRQLTYHSAIAKHIREDYSLTIEQ